jgi:hypothetical protein
MMGQKLLLKVFPEIESNSTEGGHVNMDFRMLNFGLNESLRIGIDGVTYLLKSENTKDWEHF